MNLYTVLDRYQHSYDNVKTEFCMIREILILIRPQFSKHSIIRVFHENPATSYNGLECSIFLNLPHALK